MVSSGMLRRVTLVRTDVSEELSASFIRVDAILHSHRRENLKSCIVQLVKLLHLFLAFTSGRS
jgi:hypothetical protein